MPDDRILYTLSTKHILVCGQLLSRNNLCDTNPRDRGGFEKNVWALLPTASDEVIGQSGSPLPSEGNKGRHIGSALSECRGLRNKYLRTIC